MNAEKLAKLQTQVRIGGKGTARRKKKIVRKVTTADDKKIQSSLKKLSVNNINGIEEVRIKNIFTVIYLLVLQSSLKKLSVNNIDGIEEVRNNNYDFPIKYVEKKKL